MHCAGGGIVHARVLCCRVVVTVPIQYRLTHIYANLATTKMCPLYTRNATVRILFSADEALNISTADIDIYKFRTVPTYVLAAYTVHPYYVRSSPVEVRTRSSSTAVG